MGTTRSNGKRGFVPRERDTMAIQFLLVTFTEQRSVLANGESVGFTNHTLMLPSGEYEVALDGSGYTPASQDVSLVGTSIVKPLVVAFSAATDALADAPMRSAPDRPPATAKATKAAEAAKAPKAKGSKRTGRRA